MDSINPRKEKQNMILKSTLLAVVVFLGSLTVAEAQSYINGGQIFGWGGPEGDWAFYYFSSFPTFFCGANTWYYSFFANNCGVYVLKNPGFRPHNSSSLSEWKFVWPRCH